jgi:hypothetical protein
LYGVRPSGFINYTGTYSRRLMVTNITRDCICRATTNILMQVGIIRPAENVHQLLMPAVTLIHCLQFSFLEAPPTAKIRTVATGQAWMAIFHYDVIGSAADASPNT